MSNNRRRKRWISVISVAGLLSACGARDSGPVVPQGPRLVVLYSTCTVSKDFLSPYVPGIEFTPNLQAFADESRVFERHNTEAGQSGVAFASIYTGVQADRHGVYHHPRNLPDDLYMVGEAFRDGGYDTHFWSGQAMAAAGLNYGQGIDETRTYDTHVMFTKHAKELGERFFANTTANGPELDAVLSDLVADPERRAFLQVNFTITHELYHEYASLEKIEAFRERYPEHATQLSAQEIAETLTLFESHRHQLQLDHSEAVRTLKLTPADVERLDAVLQLAYKACIAQLDDYFGRMLRKIEAAGFADDSLIAFTADHGETFYHESEPFHWMHGLQLAPTVIEVPLIVRGKSSGVQTGRYAGVTRSIDVYPTLAGLAKLVLPEDSALDGVDLSSAVRGEGDEPDLIAYSHTSTLGEARVRRYGREGYRTIVQHMPEADPRYMWLRLRDRDMIFEYRTLTSGGMGIQAFDLATDRYRAHDVFDATDAVHAGRAQDLTDYRDRMIRAFDPSEEISNRDILNGLKSLGYVSEDE